MSQLDPIGHKLQSLEEKLRAENESNERFLAKGLMETTPKRQSRRMFLPVMTPTPPPESETERKLNKIMKQAGILTINGKQYTTHIRDLEHHLIHLSDLGDGTSGNVVKMRHVPSGTIIAVKQMRRTGNAEENKRILMDLDVVLKSDDCPYIVQCFGYFVRDLDVWICMELMSMCFDKLLKLSKKPVPEDILGKVTVATVKALSYLKEKHGVIHRDVKPSNILIDERGNIKLCDFGISGRLIESKANTRSAGCAAYMAPERIDPKKPKYDIRADVWSLGITIVELATARSPYEGCNNDFEVLTKVLDSDPPSLPFDKEFNFSTEFRDFVSKCLTKNHQFRPKYFELLEQPFIKKYEITHVDIPNWFQSIIESADNKIQHRTIMPKPSQDSTTISSNIKNSNLNITPAVGLQTIPLTTTNAKTYTTQTQIPSYQQYQTNRYMKRDENNHHGYQLPQSNGKDGITTFHSNNSNYGDGDSVVGNIGFGNSSCSSSTTSPSPLSPPNFGTSNYYANNANNRDQQDSNGLNSDSRKYYQKSPFFQRKFNNSNSNALDISPKKETVPTTSVFSTIGQSIIRNLTTSPFSQKKHTIPQPNQIDPLWRMPITQDVPNSFDCYDTQKVSKSYTNSPFLGRKRIPTVDEKIIAAATGNPVGHFREIDYQPKQQSNEKREIVQHSQRTAGSHSPLVLQRFYHQQNQIREKEVEMLHQRQQYSPEKQTNPFLCNPNYGNPSTTTTTTTPASNFHYNQYYSHIPIPTATVVGSGGGGGGRGAISISSHSTSSQSSSTLSSYSQMTPSAATNANENFGNSRNLNLEASSAFGVGNTGGHLQYQPLPQQYTTRNSRNSPARSPEQLSEPIVVSNNSSLTGNMANKLNKFYAKKQLQGSSSLGSSSNGSNNSRIGLGNDISMISSKENHQREDQVGWFNTLAGAMKRQFASYVKLQLNSSASSTQSATTSSSQSTMLGNKNPIVETSTQLAETSSSITGGRSSLPYYQRSSSLTGNSVNSANSNSLSPTELRPKIGMEGNTGSFLRRYAASSGNSSHRLGDFTPTTANAHILAGLDRRHRSPDPPPRYNRGQSPLLLRKNLLELSGQPPGGSPMMNRRYVTASPPLPPPRHSESVPGSPQHFRTRIHYTPEPQRRIYRTIDQ